MTDTPRTKAGRWLYTVDEFEWAGMTNEALLAHILAIEAEAAAGPRDLHHHDVPGVGALWWDADGKIIAGPEDD